MDGTRNGSCSTCFFWKPINPFPNPTLGLCRRHAPRPEGNQTANGWGWPSTSPEDWCGEYHYEDPGREVAG